MDYKFAIIVVFLTMIDIVLLAILQELRKKHG